MVSTVLHYNVHHFHLFSEFGVLIRSLEHLAPHLIKPVYNMKSISDEVHYWSKQHKSYRNKRKVGRDPSHPLTSRLLGVVFFGCLTDICAELPPQFPGDIGNTCKGIIVSVPNHQIVKRSQLNRIFHPTSSDLTSAICNSA